MNQMQLAILIFAATYILLLLLPKYRAYVAFIAAIIFVVLNVLPLSKVFSAVDWNVIMMIGGTMGIVYFFIKSKMPSLLADMLIRKMPNVQWAVIALSLFAGIISAFVDNVATVLMVAPVALNIAKKLKISPVVSIICIAISSNLQGVATLVGDTTSIMLGSQAGMNFLDFFFFKGRIGMFWIVQVSALVSALVLVWFLRKNKEKIIFNGTTDVNDYFPTVLLAGMIVLLIVASFIPDTPATINGMICVGLFVIGLIREIFKEKNIKAVISAVKEIDYFTLLLLASLFVIIAGITEAGVILEISKILVSLGNDNLFLIYTILVWGSVLVSAFIDNIPYVATMLPVVHGIAGIMAVNPVLLYLGLCSGATLGGNLTPIGASANIAGLGILRKNGYEVKAGQFMKISVPFTLAAVLTGYILIWLIYSGI
jgi:Na+/H+ antiporter NhaD/arsenite permease-like protein